MNGKIKIRHIYKAEELKRFAKLEGKYHHMGETHSGGDTMRIVFEDGNGKWLAPMVWGSACYEERGERRQGQDMAFDLVMRKDA